MCDSFSDTTIGGTPARIFNSRTCSTLISVSRLSIEYIFCDYPSSGSRFFRCGLRVPAVRMAQEMCFNVGSWKLEVECSMFNFLHSLWLLIPLLVLHNHPLNSPVRNEPNQRHQHKDAVRNPRILKSQRNRGGIQGYRNLSLPFAPHRRCQHRVR